jgi:Ca2+-dependent lipid-binding protein
MLASQRQIKVSKTDVVGINVSDWSNGETITTLAVTNADGLLTVNSTSISGDIMLVSITGVAEGAAVLDFEYSTATRNECTELTVYVIEDC